MPGRDASGLQMELGMGRNMHAFPVAAAYVKATIMPHIAREREANDGDLTTIELLLGADCRYRGGWFHRFSAKESDAGKFGAVYEIPAVAHAKRRPGWRYTRQTYVSRVIRVKTPRYGLEQTEPDVASDLADENAVTAVTREWYDRCADTENRAHTRGSDGRQDLNKQLKMFKQIPAATG